MKTIKFNIPSEKDRENMVWALATSGYKVWIVGDFVCVEVEVKCSKN